MIERRGENERIIMFQLFREGKVVLKSAVSIKFNPINVRGLLWKYLGAMW